jgi:hypothetical protein
MSFMLRRSALFGATMFMQNEMSKFMRAIKSASLGGFESIEENVWFAIAPA